MSMSFTKLFSSITESTIWIEDDHTRIVWITMLAMADRKGRIWASIPGLANRARVPDESVRVAIRKFMSPDPDSRTKTFEGKRIEEIDGGWRLLNYEKYRAIRDEESVRESKRKYINNRRKGEHVENVELCRTLSTQAEAEAEAEAEASVRTRTRQFDKPSIEMILLQAAKIGLPPAEGEKFFNHYESNGWKVGRNSMRSWPAALSNWKLNRAHYSPLPTNGHPLRIGDLRTVLQAKETQAAELKARHRSETATGATWSSDEARKDYVKLKGEIKGLIEKIGAMA